MELKKLEAYADLIVKTGINPVPGQEILVIAGLDQPEFVRMVVEKCYQAGASRVVVTWDDMPLAKLDQTYRSEDSLSDLADWELAQWKWRADSLRVRISSISARAISSLTETLQRQATSEAVRT